MRIFKIICTETALHKTEYSPITYFMKYVIIDPYQFSHSVMSNSLWPHELQHARPPCPSPTPGVHSNSRPSSQWCHPAISSSVVPFSSCPQSLPARSRSSTHVKGHEKGGSAYAKVGSSLRSPPGNSRASTPKTKVCLLSALCSHLHLWLYGGLSPTTSLWKKS